jgi:uncharacterized protein (DUF849 family)
MPSKSKKVIITCAPTGAIHTPSMSPYLPVTADEIAEAGIAAYQAGAAILHLHARDPQDGRPTQDPEVFRPFLERLHAETNAVINLTTGGSPHMTVEDRMRPAMTYKPEVASLNMGSMNFGLFPMLDRFKDLKHDWEREHLEKSRNLIFKNTFQDVETILRRGTDNGTRFEFECYDISHLYNLAHFLDRKLATPPLFVQTLCICDAPQTGYLEMPTNGQFSVQDVIRFLWRPSVPPWDRTYAWGLRIHYGSAQASSPNRAPSRSNAFVLFWKP